MQKKIFKKIQITICSEFYCFYNGFIKSRSMKKFFTCLCEIHDKVQTSSQKYILKTAIMLSISSSILYH